VGVSFGGKSANFKGVVLENFLGIAKITQLTMNFMDREKKGEKKTAFHGTFW